MQNNKVIWYEGMLLQPQHFQQQNRYYEYLIHEKQKILGKNCWGFSELEIDTSLLSIGKINISKARGIFPDGTAFNIPEEDLIPEAFSIPEGINNTVLYLAMPLLQNSKESNCDRAEGLYRYQVTTRLIEDNNDGQSKATEIQIGTAHCRIISEHEDLNYYAYLPIVRIKESRTNFQITLDNTFSTILIDIHNFHYYSQLIKEFHGLLQHRGEMLAGRLTDTEQTGTAEMIDFMLLQLVNRYEPLFHFIQYKKPLHPEELYRILIQLMGEIATFTHKKRRPIEPPIYQHNDLNSTYKPVIRELRAALSMVLEQNAIAIVLESRAYGLWVGHFSDKILLQTCNFILAVYADIPMENLRKDFSAQIKIAPVEQITTLVSRALPSIDLKPMAVAPRQIPYHANFCYFTLNKNHDLWKFLERSAGIAFHIGNHFPGLKLELWAIKG